MPRVTVEHIDARVRAIKASAARVFVEKGVEAATMQEIAAGAGLSAGALYRYFAGKDALVRVVIADWMAGDSGAYAAGRNRPAIDILHRWLARIGERLAAGRLRETTLLGFEVELAAARRPGEVGEDHRAMRRAELAFVQALVERAQAEGSIASTVDARTLAALLDAMVSGLHWLNLELQDDLDPPRVAGLLSALVEHLHPGR